MNFKECAKVVKLKLVYKVLKATVCVVLIGVLMFLLFGCNSKNKLNKASKNLNEYSISATLCAEDNTVTATQKVNYINSTGQALQYVVFNLYGTAFSNDAKILPYTTLNVNKCFPNGISYGDIEITSARVNLSNANYQIIGQDNNALKVDFGFELLPKESVEIELSFKLTLANCTHRLGYYNGNINLGNWYPILAVFEDGEFNAIPYYSSGDPFYSECANYNITFYYQSTLTASHSGKLLSTEEQDGIVCDKYEAKAVRDFALCLSSNFGKFSQNVDGVEVGVFCDEQNQNAQKYLNASVKALQLFNKLFGEYPYSTLEVVFTPFLHGGMEYPNIVFIADDITDELTIIKVIVHEIAHQWWYAVVGNNEVTNAWFDESLAEYSTLLFFENYPEYNVTRESMVNNAIQDYLLYIDVVKGVNLSINQSMQLPVNNYSSEYEYVYMVYVKGLVFVNELRNALGDSDFFAGLKTLYKDNSFKVVTKTEFIEAFSKANGADVTSFVEGWLSGNTNIE